MRHLRGAIRTSQDFNTPEQAAYIKAHALAHITGQLDVAMRSARKPKLRAGFLTMTWSYKPGARPLVVPAEAEPAMTQRSTCEACGCRYASIGAAFLSPQSVMFPIVRRQVRVHTVAGSLHR